MASCCLVCRVTRLVLSTLTSATVSLSEQPCRVVAYWLVKSSRVCRKVTLPPRACAFACAAKIAVCRVLNPASSSEVPVVLTLDQPPLSPLRLLASLDAATAPPELTRPPPVDTTSLLTSWL